MIKGQKNLKLVHEMIGNVRKVYKDSEVERILELPQRTIKEWEKGNVKPEDLALLRILNYAPELIVTTVLNNWDSKKTLKEFKEKDIQRIENKSW